MSAARTPTPLICDDCGKQMQPFALPAAHDCDGGEALRKTARELFAPTMDLIERTIAKAGTGILRGVFEVAAERDRLRNSHDALVAALEDARDIVDNIVSGFPANDQVLLETLGYMDAALKAARGES